MQPFAGKIINGKAQGLTNINEWKFCPNCKGKGEFVKMDEIYLYAENCKNCKGKGVIRVN